MAYQKPDYARYKAEINLSQYAAYLGYEIDRKKSTRSSIAMSNGHDKVIISRRGGIWVYFSICDDGDNGTVFDFAAKRTGKTPFEIAKDLSIWCSGGISLPEPKHYAPKLEEPAYESYRIRRIFRTCQPANDHDYLYSRGLKPSLLSHPRFKGRIYQDRYGNAVFPHFNAKGICGLELKNEGKNFFVRGSEKTLWRSHIMEGDRALIIAEAVIDALSYHALFKPENAIYMATGGGMSQEQSGLIKSFSETYKSIRNIIIITDNDAGGDGLTKRICDAIDAGDFTGTITRHSPDKRGADWNDVLGTRGGVVP